MTRSISLYRVFHKNEKVQWWNKDKAIETAMSEPNSKWQQTFPENALSLPEGSVIFVAGIYYFAYKNETKLIYMDRLDDWQIRKTMEYNDKNIKH